MSGDLNSYFADCDIELTNIQGWINDHKLHSNVRFLVNYAVVKACGVIETTFKKIIFNKLTDGANQYNINYLTDAILNSSSNPSTGQIQRILEKIDSDLAEEFKGNITGKGEKGDLNSLVKLRNSFSHGHAITASIEDVIKYFNGGKEIIKILQNCIYN